MYGISTKYGVVNFKFVNDTSSRYVHRYVQLLHIDNQMADEKRVHIERKRQFLQDLQTFINTGNPAYLDTVKKDDFPDPTIRIKYDNKSIMKTTIPDNISVQWNNDFEANVVLTKQGREPSIVKVEFK